MAKRLAQDRRAGGGKSWVGPQRVWLLLRVHSPNSSPSLPRAATPGLGPALSHHCSQAWRQWDGLTGLSDTPHMSFLPPNPFQVPDSWATQHGLWHRVSWTSHTGQRLGPGWDGEETRETHFLDLCVSALAPEMKCLLISSSVFLFFPL